MSKGCVAIVVIVPSPVPTSVSCAS